MDFLAKPFVGYFNPIPAQFDEENPNCQEICPHGTIPQPGIGCEECPYGKESNNGVCVDCPAGRYRTTQSWCVDCPYSTYQDETGSAQCKNCPAGREGAPLISIDQSSLEGGCKKCILDTIALILEICAHFVIQDTQMKIEVAVQHAHLRKRKIVTKKYVSNVHWEG